MHYRSPSIPSALRRNLPTKRRFAEATRGAAPGRGGGPCFCLGGRGGILSTAFRLAEFHPHLLPLHTRSATIDHHFPINGHCHKLIALRVLKLHDLMPPLAPVAPIGSVLRSSVRWPDTPARPSGRQPSSAAECWFGGTAAAPLARSLPKPREPISALELLLASSVSGFLFLRSHNL